MSQYTETVKKLSQLEGSGRPELACSEPGCANPWTVINVRGNRCSAHAWPASETASINAAELVSTLRHLATQIRAGQSADPKAWAKRLANRAELSRVQREAVRAALAERAPHSEDATP